jgi:hypothetical protein
MTIHAKLKALNLLVWQQNRIEGTAELRPSTYTLLGLVQV